MELLKRYVDVFAWTYDEMPGLDLRLVVDKNAKCHIFSLNV